MTTAPSSQVLRARIASQIAAGTANATIGNAPFAGVVASANFTPDAAITGATATKRTITLENRGQAGAGTTVIATLDLITGVNPAAFDEYPFTLSVVALATTVAEDDVIAVKEAVTSTGTANPGGVVEVTFTRGNVSA